MAALMLFPSTHADVAVTLICLQLLGFSPLCCISLLLGKPGGDAGLDARHGGFCLICGMLLRSCNYSGAFCSVTWKQFDPFGHL